MKKLLAVLMSAAILASFAACSNDAASNSKTEQTTSQSSANEAVQTTSPSVETDNVDWVPFKEYSLDSDSKVKNIILMIGDGMGENIIKAAEIVKGDKLIMSGLPNQTHVTTYSQSVTSGEAEFTDSAAAATALSTGVKTYNQCIGVDKDGNSLETICEFAQKYDMKTGLVDRHYVCHATPAGMAAHNSNRGNYVQILRDMAKTGVNVMFGGGEQYYKNSNKTKNYINEKGYKFIDTEEQLLALDGSDDKVLGMFAYENMKNAYREPTLTTMTSKALDLLDNDKGFFLMVEGSNIDVCESEQDMKGTIEQMMAFDHTVDYVLNWAQQHQGTLVLVTADHETGGVQIPDNATADDINNDCFTSDGEHTNTNVLLMAGGAQSAEICSSDVIDNTDIAKYMRKVLTDSHK
ncbi:alkaline phosphatase [Ruminococcus sp. YE282]|uniref:alkaline phosphatase n=1 Tax=Ruminococcus sp. YE282 TaxID=3158780 RepID=UPI00088D08FD|nr:alkaline phosphatase [Ruminococcus bromii]SCY26811.1 alkaline phosphatase [Ruminococcus bromii]